MRYKIKELAKVSSSKCIYAKEYTEKGVPFYRGKEIIEKSNGNHVTNELFISKERFNEISNKYNDVPCKNDILITAVGTIGKTYLVKEKDLPFYYKDGNLIRLSDWNRERVLPSYLYYWFNSITGENAIKEITIGSTQQAITINELSNIVVDLPTIDKQRQLAQRMLTVDRLINNNRQINDNLVA